MKTQALKGMRDLLPAEQTLRDYIQGKILATYRSAGFERISTPMLEDMENLDKSEGGDNLNLIFKVLKRGDKLTAALNTGDPKQLSDMGLRYDLTLPLSRYYAANKDKLPNPFKVIQTDRVFRAERPQKGRLREFVQCDIDILGDASPNAEVELIDVTTRALLNIGFTGFTVNINDRRILRGMLESMGFAADTLDSVCITFDKMDKIGAEGVKAELTEKQLPESAINALADFIAAGDVTLDAVAARCADPAIADDLKYVLATANTLAAGRYQVAYCPSLVRGQGYYTGMVFDAPSIWYWMTACIITRTGCRRPNTSARLPSGNRLTVRRCGAPSAAARCRRSPPTTAASLPSRSWRAVTILPLFPAVSPAWRPAAS